MTEITYRSPDQRLTVFHAMQRTKLAVVKVAYGALVRVPATETERLLWVHSGDLGDARQRRDAPFAGPTALTPERGS